MADDRIKVTAGGPHFAPVPYSLLEDKRISDPTTIAVYAALSRFANYESADCWPSLRKIGKLARCSDDTVGRHLKLLVETGYIERHSGAQVGGVNHYHLVDAWGHDWKPAAADPTAPVRYPHRTHAVPPTAPMRHERDLGNEIQERGGDPPTPESTEGKIVDLLAPYVDKPAGWLRKNAERLAAQLRRVGSATVLGALSECVEHGKVDFFFTDFGKWEDAHRAREKQKPALVYPTVEAVVAAGQAVRPEERDPEVGAALGEYRRSLGKELVNA